ncbi:MAG: calcium-binding protein [Actinomycetota bacterium]
MHPPLSSHHRDHRGRARPRLVVGLIIAILATVVTAVGPTPADAALRFYCDGRLATIYPGIKSADLPPGASVKLENGRWVFRGTNGNDVIVGTGGRDAIYSYGGDDVVCGTGSRDRINTGTGNDRAFGGTGDDVITTGRGTDVAYGEGGSDRINGGHGTDTLHGGSGNDELTGGPGNDTLHGGTGSDTMIPGSDFDRCGDNSQTLLNGSFGCELSLNYPWAAKSSAQIVADLKLDRGVPTPAQVEETLNLFSTRYQWFGRIHKSSFSLTRSAITNTPLSELFLQDQSPAEMIAFNDLIDSIDPAVIAEWSDDAEVGLRASDISHGDYLRLMTAVGRIRGTSMLLDASVFMQTPGAADVLGGLNTSVGFAYNGTALATTVADATMGIGLEAIGRASTAVSAASIFAEMANGTFNPLSGNGNDALDLVSLAAGVAATAVGSGPLFVVLISVAIVAGVASLFIMDRPPHEPDPVNDTANQVITWAQRYGSEPVTADDRELNRIVTITYLKRLRQQLTAEAWAGRTNSYDYLRYSKDRTQTYFTHKGTDIMNREWECRYYEVNNDGGWWSDVNCTSGEFHTAGNALRRVRGLDDTIRLLEDRLTTCNPQWSCDLNTGFTTGGTLPPIN